MSDSTGLCPVCGGTVVSGRRGRPRTYCSDLCRRRSAADKARIAREYRASIGQHCSVDGCDRGWVSRGVCGTHARSANYALREPKLKRCACCADEFEPSGARTRYCSPECKSRNAYSPRHAISYGTCVVCEKLTVFRSAKSGKTCPTGPCRTTFRNQQASEFARRYFEENGEHYSTRYRRVNGRNDAGYAKTCEQCAVEFVAPKSDAKFCSPKCYTTSKRSADWASRPKSRPQRWWRAHFRHCRIAKGHGGRGYPFVVDSSGVVHDRQPFGTRFKISPMRRQAIYERDEWVCQLCDCPVLPNLSPSDIWAPTLDHIVPRSRGGSHEDENLQLAHRWCNSVKGDESYYSADVLRFAS